jgi:hypothetical protein
MTAAANIALDRSERILWTGAPPQGFMLRGADLFLIPFSIIWGGGFFVAFWKTLAGRATFAGGPFSGLIFVVFGAAALYITVGRFITDIMIRSHTIYAVTTERVIIQSGIFAATLQSLNLRTLTELSLSERADGSGTIVFGPAGPWGAWSYGLAWPGIPRASIFQRIPRAREVYTVIRDAQRSVTPASASS